MSFGSAFGQDRWIIEEVFPNREGGYFVEAGALNGIDESNTVLLEREFSWRGLLVEPATGYFRALERNRKAALENVCLLDRETEVQFVEAGGHGGIPDFLSANYGTPGKRVHKKALPLARLLEKHQAPSTIEYLSLDTEGTEYMILKDFPFDRFRFLAITVEHNHNPEHKERLRDLLQKNGYILCREVLVDDWWVHESHYATIEEDRRLLWKLLNKYKPHENALRCHETAQRYQELKQLTQSIPSTLNLLSRQVRKKIRGKPI